MVSLNGQSLTATLNMIHGSILKPGEAEAAASMKDKIEEKLGWNAVVPEYLQKEEL